MNEFCEECKIECKHYIENFRKGAKTSIIGFCPKCEKIVKSLSFQEQLDLISKTAKKLIGKEW